jgi:UPF0755 protein
MWKALASNALTVFVLVLVIAAAFLAWGREVYVSQGPLADTACVQVEQGASMSAVSRSLEGDGIIRDARIFRIAADYAGRSEDLKFGSYLVPPGASMAQVLDILTAGGQSTCGMEVNFRIGVTVADVVLRELDPATQRFIAVAEFDAGTAPPPEYAAATERADLRYRVTVAEGTTAWMVVEGLKKAEFLQGTIAAVPPEGTLAPDSYEVARGGDRAQLVAQMSERQSAILAELWAGRVEGLPYATPEEALIMASIIEKETAVPDERGRVASVFVNRLNSGMRLQTDPTVIYGITAGQGPLGRGLRQSELRRETPYNTYVIDGLPPTPIALPGRAAIAAAVDPDRTDFLFFVADGTGGHAFAANLADHNENVARWREIEAQRGEEGATGVQGE